MPRERTAMAAAVASHGKTVEGAHPGVCLDCGAPTIEVRSGYHRCTSCKISRLHRAKCPQHRAAKTRRSPSPAVPALRSAAKASNTQRCVLVILALLCLVLPLGARKGAGGAWASNGKLLPLHEPHENANTVAAAAAERQKTAVVQEASERQLLAQQEAAAAEMAAKEVAAAEHARRAEQAAREWEAGAPARAAAAEREQHARTELAHSHAATEARAAALRLSRLEKAGGASETELANAKAVVTASIAKVASLKSSMEIARTAIL
jgi:hypothetical protein